MGWILDVVNISLIFYQPVTSLFCQRDFFLCPKYVSIEVMLIELYAFKGRQRGECSGNLKIVAHQKFELWKNCISLYSSLLFRWVTIVGCICLQWTKHTGFKLFLCFVVSTHLFSIYDNKIWCSLIAVTMRTNE